MAAFAAINRFNAGELSPKMSCRADVEQYSGGCKTLQNFLVTPYGSVERRPGTRFISRAKYSDKPVRLIRFVCSSTVAYLIEAGDLYFRFFRDGNPVTSGGSPLEIVTPYSAAELDDLAFIQSADVMTIASKNHPVMELKRTAEDAFSLAEKSFQYPPMLDPNLDDSVTITASALSGNVSLVATIPQNYSGEPVFTAGNVGGFFELVHIRTENEISVDFNDRGTVPASPETGADGGPVSGLIKVDENGDAVSGALEVKGYWSFTTHGTWTGNLMIQRSFDNGTTWNDFRSFSSTNDGNFTDSGTEEEDDCLYRLKMNGYEHSSSGTIKLCRCLFLNPDFQQTGVVKITSVTDSTHAAATVIKKLGRTAPTAEWSEGAWSARRGFPRALTFFEERMFFAGTAHQPQRIWASKTAAWDNFFLGGKDDDGLDFVLASDTVNDIQWLMAHENALVIGTMDSEWTLSAADSGDAVTPTDFHARRRATFGSRRGSAHLVGETILFVQRGGRKVREFVYQWEKNGYASADMTVLAEHITSSGIRESAISCLPDTILWCLLGNGKLAALTYERTQEVVGWHRHQTQGFIRSIACLPAGEEDRLYWAVERDGGIYIELMAKRVPDSPADAYYVDSGAKKVSDTAFDSVAGLSHLEGQTVQILADGALEAPRVVTDGTVTLDRPAKKVILGLGYDSIVEPMSIEGDAGNGSTLLRRKTIGEVRIMLYDSVGGVVSCCASNDWEIVSRDALFDPMDSAITPKSEVVRVPGYGGFADAATVRVRQSDPLPLNVAGMSILYDVVE